MAWDHLALLCVACAPAKARAPRAGRREQHNPLECNSSSFCFSSDLRAAHVFPLPCIHLCAALDCVLRTKCCSYKRPKSERVQLHGDPDGTGVLESGDPQHPPADGPQQSGEFTHPLSLLDGSATCENHSRSSHYPSSRAPLKYYVNGLMNVYVITWKVCSH